MRFGSMLPGAAALLVAFAARGAAQETGPLILGQIVDEQTGAPIQGAFVELVDSVGVVRAGVLSNDAGHFVLSAPTPGRYTLLAQRIGYASSSSDTLVVAAGENLQYRFAVPVQAVSLEGLEVKGEKRCRMTRASGTATSVLWNEARKALDVVAWMEKQRGVPFQIAIWDRTRDLVTLDLQEGDRRLASGFGRDAFSSVSAEDLAEHGFVRRNADGSFTYFGLNAPTLLSDTFLAGHCFRAVEPDEGETGLVGLAFEPLDRKGPPDITGTLWLDRKTSELRHLEFEYTRHLFPVRVPNDRFGGRIEFLRLTNGAWVIKRWWVRMPLWGSPVAGQPGRVSRRRRMRTPMSSDQEARAGGLRIREHGGEVEFMARPAPSTPGGTAALEGTVWDSVDARPLVGATVFLADASGGAVKTDFLGRFHLRGLPAGRHWVGFFHPFTDSLEVPAILRPVTLTAAQRTSVTLSIPAGAGCHPAATTAAIVGFAESVTDGAPLSGVPVTASWSEQTPTGQSGRVEVADTTDAYGRYLLCGIPSRDPVELKAAGRAAVTLHLGYPGLVHRDLLVGGPGS